VSGGARSNVRSTRSPPGGADRVGRFWSCRTCSILRPGDRQDCYRNNQGAVTLPSQEGLCPLTPRSINAALTTSEQ
jgi:hypothetical protein